MRLESGILTQWLVEVALHHHHGLDLGCRSLNKDTDVGTVFPKRCETSSEDSVSGVSPRCLGGNDNILFYLIHIVE